MKGVTEQGAGANIWAYETGSREWRELRHVDIRSPNIFRVIKWRRVRWEGHVAHTWGRWQTNTFLVPKLWQKDTIW